MSCIVHAGYDSGTYRSTPYPETSTKCPCHVLLYLEHVAPRLSHTVHYYLQVYQAWNGRDWDWRGLRFSQLRGILANEFSLKETRE